MATGLRSRCSMACTRTLPAAAMRPAVSVGWNVPRYLRKRGFRVNAAQPAAQPTSDPAFDGLNRRGSAVTIDEDASDGGPYQDQCDVFVDRDGEFLQVMCCDYGFRSGAARLYHTSGQIPKNFFQMAIENYQHEYRALRRSFRNNEWQELSNRNVNWLGQLGYWLGDKVVKGFAAIDQVLERNQLLSNLTPRDNEDVAQSDDNVSGECRKIRASLRELKLSNAAVSAREHEREASGGGVAAPWFVLGPYIVLCAFLDLFFENRPIARFWFLESVARMPYFSYISMLHLYESLGWWRAGAELRKIHFAEEWNELHHLQVMEALGGDQLWVDRFFAQHAAIVYYWILVALFVVSPQVAYNFSELLEAHAVDTYGEFVDANEALLKSLPPPLAAATYYRSNDLYMFDEFQTSSGRPPRQPACNTLYDVFVNIRDDEGEHVKTMRACQDLSIADELDERREGARRV